MSAGDEATNTNLVAVDDQTCIGQMWFPSVSDSLALFVCHSIFIRRPQLSLFCGLRNGEKDGEYNAEQANGPAECLFGLLSIFSCAPLLFGPLHLHPVKIGPATHIDGSAGGRIESRTVREECASSGH